MHAHHLQRIKHDDGFIAALDQSGGSTPKALLSYGIPEDAHSGSGDEEMFRLAVLSGLFREGVALRQVERGLRPSAL